MKSLLKSIYHALPAPIRNPLNKLRTGISPPHTEPLMHRVMLFEDLMKISGGACFRDGRILEIGPKDGLDSKRLVSLAPRELVMIDLPEKSANNQRWLADLNCPHKYIEANFMYLPAAEHAALGKFRLIWCTGVLYHNAEQLRMLRKLYQLLDVGGYFVLESATIRSSAALRSGAYVEIHYPQTYRDTGTVTHLPSARAIKAWLNMVGFQEIHDSACYQTYNKNLQDQRYACVCLKHDADESGAYYQKSGLNPIYRFGDST